MEATTPNKTNNKSYYPWIILIAVALLQFTFVGLVVNTYSLYMDPILKQYPEISRGAFALTTTINGLANAGLSMIFGKINGKLSIRKIVLLGCIFMVACLFIFSISTNLIMFYLASVFLGASLAFCTTTTSAVMINTWFAKRTGTLVGITVTAAGIGGTICSPIIGSLLDSAGWQASFRYTAIVVAAISVIVVLIMRSKPEELGIKPKWSDDADMGPHDNTQTANVEIRGIMLKDALKTVQFWGIMVVIFLLGAMIFSVYGSLAIISAGQGYDGVTIGTVLSAMYIVNTITQIPTGYLCDKIGVRMTMALGLASFIGSLTILLMPGVSLGMMYLAAGLMGFGFVMLQVPLPIIVKTAFGDKDYGSIVGVGSAVTSLGVAAGVPLLQSGYDIFGSYSNVLMAYIPITAVCIVLSMIFIKNK